MTYSSSILRAAVLSVLVSAPLLSQQKGTGFTYDFVQHTVSTNPMSQTPTDVIAIQGKVQTDAAGHSRLDIGGAAKNPLWNAGDYILTGDSTSIVVMPATKEYMVIGGASAAGEMADMMKTTGMSMKMTDGKFTFDSLPGTEQVNGVPTTHFHMMRDGSVEMTSSMGVMAMNVSSETDYFVARGRVPSAAALSDQGNLSAGPAGLVSPELQAKMRDVAASMKGFPVRITTQSTSNVMGMNVVSTQTSEVQNLVEANVAPIVVVPPAGYTKVNMAAKVRSSMPGGD